MSVGDRSYTSDALGSMSQNKTLLLSASAEHPLYREWMFFDRWLQREEERIAEEQMLIQPLSLGDTGGTLSGSDAATAATLYHLRRQLDDAILIEEYRIKRKTAERSVRLAPSDAIKQEVRAMPTAAPRTYTLDTGYSVNFTGFDQQDMSNSSATIRPGTYTPSPTKSLKGSPSVGFELFGSMDWAPSSTPTTMPHDESNRSSVSTVRSSFDASLDARLSPSGLRVNTADTTPEHAMSPPLCRNLSATSLATMALGEGAFDWRGLCRKVQVERQSLEYIHGRERTIAKTKECDVHWQYREDMGISLRSFYRSSKDGKPRTWTMQHFPAIGPSIPLTTTHPDGQVSIEFPRNSFGKLDKRWTDINYTFNGYEAAEKFQTLLYTNNGASPAELKYDRPILSVSSDKHSTECRGKNVRLWWRSETRPGDKGPVMFDVITLLFYTSALEQRGHWVEEPHYAFELLSDSVFQKGGDKLTLVFSKHPAKYSQDKLSPRRRSFRPSVNDDMPKSPTFRKQRIDSDERRGLQNGNVNVSTGIANLNQYGYSELVIRFQNTEDRAAFLDVWKRYAKLLKVSTSNTSY